MNLFSNFINNHSIDAYQLEAVKNRAKYYHIDENIIVNELINKAELSEEEFYFTSTKARSLVENIRASKLKIRGLDAFLLKFGLSTDEGIALMCMAEALLRIPDNETRDILIRDKIGSASWKKHIGTSDSVFVNATTWALMLTGNIVSKDKLSSNKLLSGIKKIAEVSGEPFIRMATVKAMKILGKQFVLGENINGALKRAKKWEDEGYLYSYDMLGEAAKTDADALKYFNAYKNAILRLKDEVKSKEVKLNPGISIKLSALEPRYEFAKEKRVYTNLFNRTLELALLAKEYNIGLTIDAEESERLDISLDIFYKIFIHNDFKDWNGLGLAVQAYQKRAYNVIEYLIELSKKYNKQIMMRLVKGAYWDREIKFAQMNGFSDYPVFTRKSNTDVSYIACARKLLENNKYIYPQFATHNAFTVGCVLSFSKYYKVTDFEFQRLHGMGEQLYHAVFSDKLEQDLVKDLKCRIYAPVGVHKDLLSYLVRRLLENGANTSFVNRLIDAKQPIDEIIENPIEHSKKFQDKKHGKIPLPKDIFQNSSVPRNNSHGMDLSNILERENLFNNIKSKNLENKLWKAYSVINADYVKSSNKVDVKCSNDHNTIIGESYFINENDIKLAVDAVSNYQDTWANEPVENRAKILTKFADLLEENLDIFITLAVKEAGKSVINSVGEVREAADFCRYYAKQAIKLFKPEHLKGYTGEFDELTVHPKGVMTCISPWNFPLAIFVGQIVAALVTGNTVIAKPAEQTSLIAYFAIKLLFKAGLPKSALSLVLGDGERIGKYIISDPRVHGVVFTGSSEVAKIINRQLAKKESAIGTLIAETGGLNAMIVDSSALPEQVVTDVVYSAFDSAGQRCSALRILYLQDDVADGIIDMLKGAMSTLVVGKSADLSSDCGPVIDKTALDILKSHEQNMYNHPYVKLIYKVNVNKDLETKGNYFGPCAFELKSSDILTKEVFGPILHIVRYKEHELDKVIENINKTGYGLTFGVHSRIDERIVYIRERVKAGNCYANRNTIGAVVGLQPFGGEGLSGTGPKAGGPHYLTRFITERTLSYDITAQGGNASLLCLDE